LISSVVVGLETEDVDCMASEEAPVATTKGIRPPLLVTAASAAELKVSWPRTEARLSEQNAEDPYRQHQSLFYG